MTEYQWGFDTIRGVMLGLEFPTKEELAEPDCKWGIVLDLLIFRFVLLAWNVIE